MDELRVLLAGSLAAAMFAVGVSPVSAAKPPPQPVGYSTGAATRLAKLLDAWESVQVPR